MASEAPSISTAFPKPLDDFSGPVTRVEAVSSGSPIPAVPGIYAWFFRSWPGCVPVDGCAPFEGTKLLYVGISPDKRSKPNSRQNLRQRIRYHLCGNAEGSTLRRTLGILLASESGFPLRRVGSGRRMTLTHLGEQWLDTWLEENALIFWKQHPEPWTLEQELLLAVPCPLNVQHNAHHPFCAPLRQIRAAALAEARNTAIANEGNQGRRAAKGPK